MRHRLLATALLPALAAALPAQLAGTYLIQPDGGPGAFHSVGEAIAAAFVLGVGGPVDLALMPGSYCESVLVPPLPGASPQRPVRLFAAVGPGTVHFRGAAGDTFRLLATAEQATTGLVFDGLDFDAAAGHAIAADRNVGGVEVRNCTFGADHRSRDRREWRDALLVVGGGSGWHIHHNRLLLPRHKSRFSCGLWIGGGSADIHDNAFELGFADAAIRLLRADGEPHRVHGNLFVGGLAPGGAAVRAGTGAGTRLAHNSFLVDGGCCVAVAGDDRAPPLQQLSGNVFALLQHGSCVELQRGADLRSDGNLFWPAAGVVVGGWPRGFPSLADWQRGSGLDLRSVQREPQFVNGQRPPFDLHPLPSSPVRNAAVGTPPFVATDFDGRLRDAAPDIGAYESTSFAVFGSACAGDGGRRPLLSGRGTVALGSDDFAIELANARPNAYALLVGGDSRTGMGSLPLPFDLGGGCAVLAAPLAARAMVTSPAGTASAPMPIPQSGGLLGANLYFQWLVFDDAAGSRYGIATSQGGALQM